MAFMGRIDLWALVGREFEVWPKMGSMKRFVVYFKFFWGSIPFQLQRHAANWNVSSIREFAPRFASEYFCGLFCQ